jgi:hypothetical protein
MGLIGFRSGDGCSLDLPLFMENLLLKKQASA